MLFCDKYLLIKIPLNPAPMIIVPCSIYYNKHFNNKSYTYN